MGKVHIVGIGYRPLPPRARAIVLGSSVILASERLLEIFRRYDEFDAVRDRVRITSGIDEIFSIARDTRDRVDEGVCITILGDGDPLFFGIGVRAIEEFGRESVEIIPDLSSIQVAFSRIGEPWGQAFLMSLHRGPYPERRRRVEHELHEIPSLLLHHRRVAVLTDSENTPAMIARALISAPELVGSLGEVAVHVCERLGYDDEALTSGSPEEMAQREFSLPNVVILIKRQGAPR